MRLTILSTVRFTEAHQDQLRQVAPDRISIYQVPASRLADVPEDVRVNANVLYTFSALPETPDAMPRLRWIQLHSAGVDHLPEWLKQQTDIIITTTSGIHAVPMAEYTFMSILAFFRRFPRMLDYQRRGEWPHNRWELFANGELRDMTLGVVGYGSIGREIGRLGKAFGMRLLALRRHGGAKEDTGYTVPGTGDPEGRLPDAWFTPDERLDMLAQCDVIVNVLPLTPETRHFFGEREFRAMKPTAYFVNIGRGATVDEGALVRALREGWIAGAGLDVFEEEPLPEDSPLWHMENVILSPHISALSVRYDDRAAALFAANLARYLAGEPLYNVYNPRLGY